LIWWRSGLGGSVLEWRPERSGGQNSRKAWRLTSAPIRGRALSVLLGGQLADGHAVAGEDRDGLGEVLASPMR
ncbi:MAG: hypothetical protein QOJ50_334, partial [Cryptosporangiaceae bacterium]|nr:hypothetical protein [Cryptosporangiaceae bacterium]